MLFLNPSETIFGTYSTACMSWGKAERPSQPCTQVSREQLCLSVGMCVPEGEALAFQSPAVGLAPRSSANINLTEGEAGEDAEAKFLEGQFFRNVFGIHFQKAEDFPHFWAYEAPSPCCLLFLQPLSPIPSCPALQSPARPEGRLRNSFCFSASSTCTCLCNRAGRGLRALLQRLDLARLMTSFCVIAS